MSSSYSHRDELLKTEHSIGKHLSAHHSNTEIYKELNHLRTFDRQHRQSFDKDLTDINHYLQSKHADQHFPKAKIEQHGKDFTIIFEGTHSGKEAKAETHHLLPPAVQHALQSEGHQRRSHPGQHHGGHFASPQESRRDSGHGKDGSPHLPDVPAALEGNGMKTNSASPSQNGFGERLLQKLGLPVTAKNLAFLDAWQRAEGGSSDNPFNTTQDMPGARRFNGVGVKRYASMEDGLEATYKTLKLGYYTGILSALRQEDTRSASQALRVSAWGTHNMPNVG